MIQLNTLFLLVSLLPEPESTFINKESIQKEVKASLSQKATLSCEVSDSKTEVMWYKDGKQLTSSKTVRVESKDKCRQLVIDSVDKKDAGEYFCKVGTETLVFKLHLAGRTTVSKLCAHEKHCKMLTQMFTYPLRRGPDQGSVRQQGVCSERAEKCCVPESVSELRGH